MSKTPTIYQKLTKAMFGGGVQLNNSDMNQSKSITVNSYHMNPNSDDIIFRTKDKEEYEQQLLQKKQQKPRNVLRHTPVRHVAKQRQKRFQLHPTIWIRERSQRKLLVQKTERKRIIVRMQTVIKHM